MTERREFRPLQAEEIARSGSAERRPATARASKSPLPTASEIFANPLARNLCNDVHQFIDRDHPVLSQIDRIAMIALHQAVNSFDTVIDVAIRTRLSAVSPNFDIVAVIGQSNLSTNGRGRFLAAKSDLQISPGEPAMKGWPICRVSFPPDVPPGVLPCSSSVSRY